MATPIGIAVAMRQAASGYALRASPHRRTYTTSWDINKVLRRNTTAWEMPESLGNVEAQRSPKDSRDAGGYAELP